MSQEAQMFKYVNIARQCPSYFISIIDSQIASFINQKQIPIGEDILYEVNQGKNAWIEAKKFLKQQSPLPPFQRHQGLDNSARDHAKDLSNNGIFGHTGSDYSTFSQRILKHCRKGHGSMAEIIGADFRLKNRNNAELTVLGLIIDDGVTDRGHRKTIFSPIYKYIGCKSQIQGDKLITVFNLTQNKLALRSLSSLQSSGGSFTNKQSKIKFQSSRQNQSQNQPKLNRSNINQFSASGQNVFKQISNPLLGKSNSSSFKTSQSKAFNNPSSRSKKLCEKKESSRIFYEQGSKITQTTTTFIYEDGKIEELVNRHTIYLEEE